MTDLRIPFTPGPWMRDGFTVTNFAPAGEKRWPIATAYPDTRLSAGASYKRMVENARLIAAAPDMLAALYQYESDLLYPPEGDSLERRLERVRTVIANAGGDA